MSNLKAALAYGKAGFKIFPILELTKDQPLIKQWGVRASSDPTQITAWWTRWPEANIGFGCMANEVGVVDSDVPMGEDTLDNLELIEGKVLSPTRMASTPRGGIHRFYRGRLATTAGKIGPNVDTRGVGSGNGGYVMLAPSRTKVGTYKWLNKAPMAQIDPWVVEMCGGERANNGPASQEPLVEWDLDSNVKWARNYLMTDAPKCQQGAGGGDILVKFVVPVLKDHAISEEMAAEIISEPGGYNETKCEPPWQYGDCDDKDNLYVKIHNSYLYCRDRQPGDATAEADFAGTEDETDEINRINAERLAAIDAAARAKQQSKPSNMVWTDADKVKPRNVEYIWPLRLARGKHTALAGEGGKGKSQIACDAAARVTTGTEWPGDVVKAPIGRVIILSAEDDPDDTLVPRLIAAGADLTKVKFLSAVKRDDGKGERKFNLQEDIEQLKAACLALKDVVLIVLDPASSYMGGNIDTHRNTDVRRVLDPLSKLAQDLRCAVLSISHFNKGSSPKAVNRVMESAAFVNAPRFAFGVFDDDQDDSNAARDFGPGDDDAPVVEPRCLFLPLKSNYQKAPGLAYRIVDAVGGTDAAGKPVTTSKVEWLGATTRTADEVSQAETARAQRAPELSRAVRFLRQELDVTGFAPVPQVEARAQAENISLRTLRRAREKAGVASQAKGAPPTWYWYLKDRFAGLDLESGIPFVMTQDMKRRLSERGYGPEQVAQMTPQQAQEILAKPTGEAPEVS